VRIWQYGEEEAAIEAGNFTGQMVVDVRQPKQKPASSGSSEGAQEPGKPAPGRPLDLEGLGTFLQSRRKKDPKE
jgi:hypothetical protein